MLTSDEKRALGVALNQSRLLGAEVDVATCRAAATLAVLTLPETGPMPEDTRLQLRFEGVSRVIASLRSDHQDGPGAMVEPFGVDQLLEVVQSFGGQPIYGWEFIDLEAEIAKWEDRLSFDWRCSRDSATHSIRLFQDDADRRLDIALWFRTLRFFTAAKTEVPLEEVMAGGMRWWDAFHAMDPRTQGQGMFLLD